MVSAVHDEQRKDTNGATGLPGRTRVLRPIIIIVKVVHASPPVSKGECWDISPNSTFGWDGDL